MMIQRTWRRDRSRNIMPMETALANIEMTAIDKDMRNAEQAQLQLVGGGLVETRLAIFHRPEVVPGL